MNIAMLCLLFSALLIVLTKIPVAIAMNRQPGGYDNRHPRAQQARLEGTGARALAAHQNMIEAFPVFAAGVLAAQLSGADGTLTSMLAVLFVVARVIYTGLYLADFPVLRSLWWAVGYLASIGLMVVALF